MEITSIDCKLGMIHPDLHRDKFNKNELYFIERVGTHRAIGKLANRLAYGFITADDFKTGCELLHKLSNWGKEQNNV